MNEQNEVVGGVGIAPFGQEPGIKSELQFKTQWIDALGDIFGERLVDYDPIECDAL